MANRTLRWLAAGAALLAVPATAIAETVTRLAPITPWRVDWTKTSCTFSRGFGSKEQMAVLKFEKFLPNDQFQVQFITTELSGLRKSSRPSIVFSTVNDEESWSQDIPSPLVGRTDQQVPTLFVSSTAPSDHERDSAGTLSDFTLRTKISGVSVTYGDRKVVYETGLLEKPFAALDTCLYDLVKLWGLDPSQQKTLSARPSPIISPHKWIKPYDLSRGSWVVGMQMMLTYRLLVDENGKPTDCLVQQSYSDLAIDKSPCETLMRGARFKPATDALGVAVPSYYGTSRSWTLGTWMGPLPE